MRIFVGSSISAFTVLLLSFTSNAQESSSPSAKVEIRVDSDQPQGQFPMVWNYFGYDEPNYTYSAAGKKLLRELSALSPAPVYVRMHNLFTTGDGSPSLKWGSTNVYTEDARGKPVYDWTIVDRIFDTLHSVGMKPLLEIGFMPEALSSHPQPYRHNFPQGSIFTGWAYPPKNYERWAELVAKFVGHLRERFGDAELRSWLWEVWNEPDIGYWQGTPEEYFKLYDFTVEAVKKAFPEAHIGGPHGTGPANAKAAEFLRSFLDHCAHGRNYSTGKSGSPLDFIAFHAKGSLAWKGDHVQMGIATHLSSIEEGFKIISSFPEWRHMPVILGESDPEGCAACSAKDHPQNSYRNGELYASYVADVLHHTLALASRENINLEGAVTWAFEFEDQPYFAGFRELASNGLDKPVLNAFRMFGLLGSELLEVTNSGGLPTEEVVRRGIRGRPDIGAIATRKEREMEVLLWNYSDEDVPAEPAQLDLIVRGLPQTVTNALLEHFRIDATHSNSYSAWKEIGSPQSLSSEQYGHLESAGQLQLLTSPAWIVLRDGNTRLQFNLPRQALSLVRISW